MTSALRVLGAIALASLAGATVALAAPSSVATKLQLRGHLPELGETPAMWVFTTATAYDSFRLEKDVADVFPASGSLYMTFDKELLALYTRGNDSGGRCLRAGNVTGISGTTAALDLTWDASSCGAPASAHYPFVLVSLSRTADDGSAWTGGRQVCAAAPGVPSSTSCASASGGAPSPAPSASSTPAPVTPTPVTTPTLTLPPPSATPTPVRTATPVPTPAPSVSASRTPTPTPARTAVVAGSSDDRSGLLDSVGWLVVGLLVGAFGVAIAMRVPRRVTRV